MREPLPVEIFLAYAKAFRDFSRSLTGRWLGSSVPEFAAAAALIPLTYWLVFRGVVNGWVFAGVMLIVHTVLFWRAWREFKVHRPDSDPWWVFKEKPPLPVQFMWYVRLVPQIATLPLMLVFGIGQIMFRADEEMHWRFYELFLLTIVSNTMIGAIFSRVHVLLFERWLAARGDVTPSSPTTSLAPATPAVPVA